MQAVVKTPHISINIEAEKIPSNLLTILKKEFGSELKIINKKPLKKESSIIAENTEWFRKIKSKIKPSDNLKIYRTNFKYSQGKLANLLGVLPSHISEMEREKRGISKLVAKKLSEIFGVSTEKFI